jgi:hypothetical protein
LIFVLLLIVFGLQKLATYAKGPVVFLPYVLFFIVVAVIAVNWRKLANFFIFIPLLFTACNFIASDKIGVRVENFGHEPADYALVYGKFPSDWSASSWNLEFPGQSFGVPVDPFQVSTKDGVSFTCDPSVLVALIRTNEACQKFAFKFSAYKSEEDFQKAIAQIILKESVDAIRYTVGSFSSDTILFNRTGFETMIQTKLATRLDKEYGISLSQFSLTLDPPASLQQAINDRLLAQEQTKKTLAAVENAKAEVILAQIQKKKMLVQTAGYTEAYLRNKALDVYWSLSASPNKVFVLGDPKSLIIQ